MAEEQTNNESNEAAAPAKKSNLLLFILIPVLILVGIAAGIFLAPMFGGSKDKKEHATEAKHQGEEELSEEDKQKKAKLDPKHIAFVLIPDVLVNLKSSKQRPVFLKVSLALEIHDPTMKDTIENLRPKIVDQMQVFLRDLDITDVTGSSNLQRLRQELQVRVNNAVSPLKVQDVLIKDFLVQ